MQYHRFVPFKQTTKEKKNYPFKCVMHRHNLGTRETLILQHRSIVALAVQN